MGRPGRRSLRRRPWADAAPPRSLVARATGVFRCSGQQKVGETRSLLGVLAAGAVFLSRVRHRLGEAGGRGVRAPHLHQRSEAHGPRWLLGRGRPGLGRRDQAEGQGVPVLLQPGLRHRQAGRADAVSGGGQTPDPAAARGRRYRQGGRADRGGRADHLVGADAGSSPRPGARRHRPAGHQEAAGNNGGGAVPHQRGRRRRIRVPGARPAGQPQAGQDGTGTPSHAERFLGLHGSGVQQVRGIVPPVPIRGAVGGRGSHHGPRETVVPRGPWCSGSGPPAEPAAASVRLGSALGLRRRPLAVLQLRGHDLPPQQPRALPLGTPRVRVRSGFRLRRRRGWRPRCSCSGRRPGRPRLRLPPPGVRSGPWGRSRRRSP
ncbi:hypothetical protein RKD37_000273 [Streptomyces ambofaciens]